MNDQSHAAATRQVRVVIVDDSPEVRYLLTMVLETDGRFDVVGEASRAKDAVTIVGGTTPDLVLVDLRLGGKDGLWLLRELRRRHPRTALALVTGSSQPQTEAAALAAGADSVHLKESTTTTMIDDLVSSVLARAESVSA